MFSQVLPADGDAVTWDHSNAIPYYVNMTSSLTARAVRVHPRTFTGAPIMRLELYGCALGLYTVLVSLVRFAVSTALH